MKRLTLFILFIVYLVPLNAQIDRSTPPEPGPAPVIQIGDYQTFTLNNGMKVIVVENHNIPVVSFQLTLDIDPVMEYDAKGYVNMAGSLMRSGTTNRDKAEIDEEIDFTGASLSTFSTGMYGSSLTRHTDKLLDLMSDILMNPSFPEDELQKNITQTITGLSTVKTDASAMVSNISTVLVYGRDHPFGEVTTEESVSNIRREMLIDYYNSYFKPNAAYMVIVGDIKTDEAEKLMDQYFGNWQPGDVPVHNYETPLPPEGKRVAMADRTGAVQSVVSVTYPVVLKPGDPDAIKVSVMNSILGGGVFSGRLMQNLREDKGYTYGARSSLSTNRLVSRFNARTEVRNSVTDSTISEILYEMHRMTDEPADEETLELIKNYLNGSFARSLESPRTIAGFALNIERYGLPADYYDTYLEKLSRVTADDVMQMAEKYIRPDNSYIIVGGNKSEISETLEKFSDNGEVMFFDAFGRRIEDAGIVPEEGVTAAGVIENYVNAVGGAERMRQIKDLTIDMSASIQGMTLDMMIQQKAPDKYRSVMSMGGNVMQQQVFDGTRGKASGMQGTMEIEGDMLEEMKMQALMNPELSYRERGFTLKLDGVENVNGENAYKINITSPRDITITEFFSIDSGLKLRTVTTQESPMGQVTQITDYEDYREVDGMKFPFLMKQQVGPQTFDMEVKSIEINQGLEDGIFSID
ncbi:MAG: insulinase family protein [Bacteroidales bacterium]